MGLFSSNEKLPTLEDLLHHELKDLYSAETQLIEALPKMAKAASDESLRTAFTSHLEETHGQKERLSEIARVLDIDITGHTCEAMKGLVKEGEEIINSEANPAVRDAGLIGAGQRVEHYEMAGYGTAHALANELGYQEVSRLLEETLQQEKAADTKLNDIAINRVNHRAHQA